MIKNDRFYSNKENILSGVIITVFGLSVSAFSLYSYTVFPVFFAIAFCLGIAFIFGGFIALSSINKRVSVNYKKCTIKKGKTYNLNEISHIVLFLSDHEYLTRDSLDIYKMEIGSILNFALLLKSVGSPDFSTIVFKDLVILNCVMDFKKLYKLGLKINKYFRIPFVDFVNSQIYDQEGSVYKNSDIQMKELSNTARKMIQKSDILPEKKKRSKNKVHIIDSPGKKSIHYYMPKMDRTMGWYILFLLILGILMTFMHEPFLAVFPFSGALLFLLIELYLIKNSGWTKVTCDENNLTFSNHNKKHRSLPLSQIRNIINLNPHSLNLLLVKTDLTAEYIGCRNDKHIQAILHWEIMDFVRVRL